MQLTDRHSAFWRARLGESPENGGQDVIKTKP